MGIKIRLLIIGAAISANLFNMIDCIHNQQYGWMMFSIIILGVCFVAAASEDIENKKEKKNNE